jgi:hypothetical protein
MTRPPGSCHGVRSLIKPRRAVAASLKQLLYRLSAEVVLVVSVRLPNCDIVPVGVLDYFVTRHWRLLPSQAVDDCHPQS